LTDLITELFDRMDSWRHLPGYQLERRADLFFSLYLAEALEAKLGFPVRRDLVPEFPVRIGALCSRSESNQSFKIDYLALSEDLTKAILVELKTEGRSRREKQDKYLMEARRVGLTGLLNGVLDIFRATTAKRKYFCLLQRLAGLGLLAIPAEFADLMAGNDLRSVNGASESVTVISPVRECIVVYVQPNEDKDDHACRKGDPPVVIAFDEFRAVVERHADPVSVRFARSLKEWSRVRAGKPGGS